MRRLVVFGWVAHGMGPGKSCFERKSWMKIDLAQIRVACLGDGTGAEPESELGAVMCLL